MAYKDHENAITDNNDVPALTAHSGTAGTALVKRITSQNTAGAIDVHISGTSVAIGGAGGGSNVNVFTGTQQTLGTVGVLNNGTLSLLKAGTITKLEGGTLGEVTNIAGGTIGSILGIGGTVTVSGASAGTYVNITTGTQQTLGTVGVLNAGSIIMTGGTISKFPADTTNVGTFQAPNDAVTYNIANGEAGVGVQITGTYTGQLEFEVTIDDTNWIAHDFINNATDQIVNATTGTGIYFASVPTFSQVRTRASALSAGSAVVTMKTSVNSESVHLESPIPAGDSNIGNVDIVSGTITRVEGGSIVVTNGTASITTGSIVVTAGTISDLDTVGTVGVVNAGSIVVTVGTVNVTNGSIVQTSGTLTTGSLTNLATLGTVLNVNTGTLAAINNIVTGTINRVAGGSMVQTAGTVTTGSLTNVATVGTVLNLGAGTITTQLAGTLTALASGTITAGTVRQQWQAVNQVTSFGTLATAAGSAFGTISGASGAGTKHVVSGLSVVVESGTADVRVLYGSAIVGGSVLSGGKFVPSAGIQKSFTPPIESGTNSEIIYHFVGAGTAYITVQYWKSTL